MAQYLLSVLDNESNHEDPDKPDGFESAEAARVSWDATGRFNDKLKAAGYFVFANGLADRNMATVAVRRRSIPTDRIPEDDLLSAWPANSAEHQETHRDRCLGDRRSRSRRA